MNKYLQQLLQILQQGETLNAEQKSAALKLLKDADRDLEITAFKLDKTEKVKHTTAVLLEETIAELEQKRKSVEAQNRELEIEAALERVRSRSIAMRNSSELGDLSFELVKQVQALGIATWHCAFNIYDEDQESSTEWGSNANGSYPIYKTPREGIFKRYYEIGQRGETLHVEVIGEDKCADHYAYLCTLPGVGETLLKFRDSGISFPKSQIDHVAYFKYGYLLFITFEAVPEAHDVFKRFAKVFEQTYTRFLDLQKAEAQAREAKVEAALEKVRSRSMQMNNSNELRDVIQVVFAQLLHLNFKIDSASFSLNYKESDDFNLWTARPGQPYPTLFHIPYLDHPIFNEVKEAKKKGLDLFSDRYNKKDKDEFFIHFFTHASQVPKERQEFILSAAGWARSQVLMDTISLFIQNYQGIEYSSEENDILKRFGKVFEQAYTRFLDLQKSEAQARESQIQLALERVRARTMAMQHSNELPEAANLLFQQVQSLGMPAWSAGYCIWSGNKETITFWMCSEGVLQPPIVAPINEDPSFSRFHQAWKRGENFYVEEIGGEALASHYRYVRTLQKGGETIDTIIEAGFQLPTFQIFHLAYFAQGFLTFITFEQVPDAWDIFKRFAKVFEQTYTRFLDLQKAEAQAREAKIEAGLERVRSRAMAMQTSEELNALIGTVFTELTKLDLVLTRCVIMTYDQKTNDTRWWMANSEAPEQPMNFYVQYHEHPPNLAYFSAWRERTVKWIYPLEGKVKKEWDDFIFSETELRLLPDFVIAGMKAPDRVYLNASFHNSGNLTLASLEPLSDEHFDILIRFAKVFDLTYTRFNDLKQAEAQAREAKIETALERVRSRTMAMQRSDELVDVASILFQQVKALGVPQWNCGLNIWEIGDKEFTYYPGSPDGIILPTPCKIPLTEHPVFISFDESRKRGDELFVYEKQGEYQAEHYRYMLSLRPGVGDLLQSMLNSGFQLPTFQIDHVANFSYGNLIFITYEHFPEMYDVFKRFAKVFEQTYTRFLDLQQSERQGREAQIQLALERVRARTMAMQHSNELRDAASVLFQQVKELGIDAWTCGFSIWDEDRKAPTAWLSRGVMQPPFRTPLTENQTLMHFYEAAQRGESLFVEEVSGETLTELYRYLGTLLVAEGISDEIRKPGYAPPTFQVNHVAYFSYGYLLFITYKQYPEAHDIFKRFAKVFDQTYTRFLDLQKAEAQVREAQIEAALERVRSNTMAMHKSEQLAEVATVLFEQFYLLGKIPDRISIGIIKDEAQRIEWWVTNQSGSQLDHAFISNIQEYTIMTKIFVAWKNGDNSIVLDLIGEDLDEWIRYVRETLKIDVDVSNFKGRRVHQGAFFSAGILLLSTHVPVGEEVTQLLGRFARVFNQTYTRFLDLLKAEAQARESQIEASLERVRSKTMAMHNSRDVGDTVATLFDELKKLGVKTNRCGILIFSNTNDTEVWTARSTQSPEVNLIIGHLDVSLHPMLTSARNAWKNKDICFSYEMTGNDLINYYQSIRSQPDYPIQVNMDALPSKEIHTEFYFPEGAVFAFTSEPIPVDDTQIFKRLAGVFGQTYRRYLDLQKAEAQARKAQIEAALERVRSRTMAMHRSEEIADIVGKIFKELTSLDVALNRVLFWIFNSDEKYFTWWSANSEAESNAESYRVDYVDHPVFSTYFDAWQKKLPLLLYTLGDDLKVSWDDHLFKDTELSRLPKAVQDGMRSEKEIFTTSAIGEYGLLMAGGFEPFSDEVNDIIQRFGRVFQQSYTRYVDVQKAEAQAREAQIEAALERTRTQSMLMQHSVQLDDTLRVFHEQVLLLGIKSAFSFLWLPDEKNDRHIFWAAWAENSSGEVKKDSTVFKSKAINYPLDRNEPATAQCLVDWKSDQPVYSYHVPPADVENYFAAWKELLDGVEKLNPEYFQGGLYYVEAFMKYGCFGVMLEGEMPEVEKKILGRLAIEFERAYTRFLDLQRAEAQAREATIEASLEKVRGKAISMHNSSDLTATASLVFTELRKLGIDSFRSGVGLLTKENRNVKLYSATSSEEGGSFSLVGWAVLDHHPVLSKTYDSWIKNEDYYPVLKGETLKSYYENISATFTVPVEQSEGYEQYGYFLPFSEGLFYGWSEKPYTETEIKILHRFRGIVDLTFRRYMELEKSEAIAKEAIRQASLDRVRAEIASMRTVNDLDRITPLIWKELNILSIPFVRCGVFIMDDFQQLMHTFLSTPEGEAIAAFHLPYNTPGNTGEILSHWKNKQMYISHWDETAFSELGELLVKQGAIPSKDVYMSTIPSGGIHLHCLPFLQGMLYVGNTTQLKEDDIHLIQSVADAFSTAYARYEDFNNLESAKVQIEKTLTDLKQTQNLLVQSEKMASLGELTAGIAHEIQNPLNFVNNFSEVSNELLEEMEEEIEKGNFDEVHAITNNIKQNLEKILHHGKRADGIVKGMLQHSRSSSGVKEPTDINALADEYLRLAYHGFRAKDKSFNASTNTDLDKSIGKINIVPQDIGRVVLNLITNAFYAVTEKQKKTAAEYQPTVFLSTKRRDNCVLISVKDNGDGIPEQIREKIFQPFFTTKPTGQGTGLGLSLSYDIVKAHGGELKVETTPGEGSEFIISIML